MLYNILSIVLGLAALIFALHSVRVKGCLTCCTLSFTCCGASLACQLLEMKRRAALGDWAAIEDTIGAVSFCAGFLLILTIAFNLIALWRSGKKCG